MPQNTATLTIEDYNRETSTTSVNIGPLTAANYTAKHAAIDAYKTAVAGITLGEIRKVTVNEVFAESVAAITDVNAQRERKWLVTFRDNTEFFDAGDTISNVGYGQLFKVEIPCADLGLLDNNLDVLALDDTFAAAYVTAAEALVNSPWGGNECVVVKIDHVGRNL